MRYLIPFIFIFIGCSAPGPHMAEPVNHEAQVPIHGKAVENPDSRLGGLALTPPEPQVSIGFDGKKSLLITTQLVAPQGEIGKRVPVSTQVELDLGPAGNHRIFTDEKGMGAFDIGPISHRLPPDFHWVVKASMNHGHTLAMDAQSFHTDKIIPPPASGLVAKAQEKGPRRKASPVGISLTLMDPNKNDRIDPRERVILTLRLKNRTRRDVMGIHVVPMFEKLPEGISLVPLKGHSIDRLRRRASRELKFIFVAQDQLSKAIFNVQFQVRDTRKRQIASVGLNLETQPMAQENTGWMEGISRKVKRGVKKLWPF